MTGNVKERWIRCSWLNLMASSDTILLHCGNGSNVLPFLCRKRGRSECCFRLSPGILFILRLISSLFFLWNSLLLLSRRYSRQGMLLTSLRFLCAFQTHLSLSPTKRKIAGADQQNLHGHYTETEPTNLGVLLSNSSTGLRGGSVKGIFVGTSQKSKPNSQLSAVEGQQPSPPPQIQVWRKKIALGNQSHWFYRSTHERGKTVFCKWTRRIRQLHIQRYFVAWLVISCLIHGDRLNSNSDAYWTGLHSFPLGHKLE